MDLRTLEELAASCTLCDLHKGRENPVFAKGNSESRFMICGMVPARDENKQGIPFVGRAGKLLDVILSKSGIDDVYVTNLVKCFLAPGKKLDPSWIEACLPYILSQIGAMKPYVIITLGADSTNALLGMTTNTSIGRMRGTAHDWGKRTEVIPTYHPSFLLRKGGEKSPFFQKVLDDFELAKKTHDAMSNKLTFM